MPIAATKKHRKRVDYEYERTARRASSCSRNPCQAFGRRRLASVGPVHWAIEVAQLLDTRYASCAKMTLVCDNLNTHTKGAFYTAFPPSERGLYQTDQLLPHAQARQLAEYRRMRVELPHEPVPERTPHRRTAAAAIGDRDLGRQTNAKQRGVDWQFKIDDARTKLKRLYPKI